MNEQQVARGLGWFSIALGAAELLAPKKVAAVAGIEGREEVIRGFGLREIGVGMGILLQKRPSAGWLWSRVAGDALDLGALGAAWSNDQTDRRQLGTALALVVGVTALDMWCATQLDRRANERRDDGSAPLLLRGRRGRVTRKVITINRPAADVYEFWRNFENLPRFMNHLKAVQVGPDGTSHWVAKGPANADVEWDAEIVDQRPNEFISWRSLPGGDVDNAGSVRFTPATGGRGTVVRVDLRYRVPGGPVGSAVAKLFGESPEKQIPQDLLRVKQLLETGEIARTEGQSAGRARSTSRKFDDFIRA